MPRGLTPSSGRLGSTAKVKKGIWVEPEKSNGMVVNECRRWARSCRSRLPWRCFGGRVTIERTSPFAASGRAGMEPEWRQRFSDLLDQNGRWGDVGEANTQQEGKERLCGGKMSGFVADAETEAEGKWMGGGRRTETSPRLATCLRASNFHRGSERAGNCDGDLGMDAGTGLLVVIPATPVVGGAPSQCSASEQGPLGVSSRARKAAYFRLSSVEL